MRWFMCDRCGKQWQAGQDCPMSHRMKHVLERFINVIDETEPIKEHMFANVNNQEICQYCKTEINHAMNIIITHELNKLVLDTK